MDPQKEFDALDAERAQLLQKMNDTPEKVTKQDTDRADVIVKRLGELRPVLAKRDAATKALSAAASKPVDHEDEESSWDTAGGTAVKGGFPSPSPHTEAFARASGAIAAAFKMADPVTGGVSKALVPSGSVTIDYQAPIVSMPRHSHFLLSRLRHIPVEQPTGSYLRQSVRDFHAESVAVGDDKPVSDLAFTAAQWGVSTIAHLSKPIPRQHLSDFTGVLPVLSNELMYGLALSLERLLIHGHEGDKTDEMGEARPGLLTSSGVLQTEFQENYVESLLNGISDLEATGVDPDLVVLNPTDARQLIGHMDAEGRYYSGGPVDRPKRQIWGVPYVLSSAMPVGQSLVLDTSAIAVLVREGISIRWDEFGTFNDGEGSPHSLFGSNQIVFLCEGRWSLVLSRPHAVAVVNLTEDAGEGEGEGEGE